MKKSTRSSRLRLRLVHRNTIPLRFFLSYLVVFVIAIVSAWASYSEAQRIVTANVEEFNLKTLTSIRDLVDERLSQVNAVIYRIAAYYQTNFVLNLEDPVKSKNMYQIKEYMDYLYEVSLGLSPNAYLFVYAKKNGYVVQGSFASKLPMFFHETIRSETDIDANAWAQRQMQAVSCTLQPETVIYLSGVKQRVLPYIQQLPIGSTNSTGFIGLYISYKSLLNGMIDISDMSSFSVLNEEQKLITSFALDPMPIDFTLPQKDHGLMAQTVNGQDAIVVYLRSSRGLIYVSVTPKAIIMRQANHLRLIHLLTTMICFALSLILSGYFIKKNAMPVSRVYQMLKERNNREDDHRQSSMQYITQSVHQLLEDNDRLYDSLQSQKREMKMTFFSNVLNGALHQKKDLLHNAEYMGITQEPSFFVVVVFRIMCEADLNDSININQLHIIKAALRQVLEPISNTTTVIDTAANQLSLVFQFTYDNPQRCCFEVNNAVQTIIDVMQRLNVPFKAMAGRPRTKLTSLYQAHMEAALTLDHISNKNSRRLIWYEDELEHGEIFYYPMSIENKITANLQTGNEAELRRLLDYVYAENCLRRQISDAMGKLLIAELKGTFLRATKNTDSARKLVDQLLLPSSLPVTGEIKRIRGLYLNLCHSIREHAKQVDIKFQHSLKDYIDQHITDSQLSLTMASEHFALSESYFSSVFKKQMGENFVNYITQKRMALSRALLTDNQCSIEEIARKVGYTSAHSFRRAFKKFYGVSPAAAQKGG